jgi:hypothetical protein
MKKVINIIFMLTLGLLLFSGCIGKKETSAKKPKEINTHKMEAITESSMPADIQLVFAAILNRVKGERKKAKRVKNVWFTRKGKHTIAKDFKYKGFLPAQFSITGHEAVQISSSKVKTTLEGALLLKDEFDRSAGLYFAAQYITTKKGIVITKSFAGPVSPNFPRIEAYIVRKSDFDATPKGSLKSYTRLYTFALKNAVSMVAKSKFIKKGIEDEFLFLVFCKDRLLDASKLTMKVTAKAKMIGDSLIEPIYLNDNGFRFFIGAGKFHTAKRDHRFHIGVKYALDPMDESKSIIVADFTNMVR